MFNILDLILADKLKDSTAFSEIIDDVPLSSIVLLNTDHENNCWTYNSKTLWLPNIDMENVVEWCNMHNLFYSILTKIDKNKNILLYGDPLNIVGSIFKNSKVYNQDVSNYLNVAIKNNYKEYDTYDNKLIDVYIALNDDVCYLRELPESVTDAFLTFNTTNHYDIGLAYYMVYFNVESIDLNKAFTINKLISNSSYTVVHYKKDN